MALPAAAQPSAPASQSPEPTTNPTSATEPAALPAGPPPEPTKDIERRSRIVWSFWLIVALLGFPIWYQTTKIYRADLPVDRMLSWAEGKACRPVFPLQITVQAPSLQEPEAQNLVRLTQHALDDLNDFSGHHLRLRLASSSAAGGSSPDDKQLENALTIHLKNGDATSAQLNPHSPVLDITYPTNSLPSQNSASSPLASYIARELRSTFAEEQAIISYLLSNSSMPADSRLKSSTTPELTDSISKRTTRTLRYAPTYHLSFSLFTDGALPSTWDFNAAVNAYIQPMLDVLRSIHDFTIDSQVQLYATPGAQREVLQKEDLASFINAAEWPLSPSIGGAPTVNFVLYVGNQTIATGASDDETSQSWLIPQWGTVFLLQQPANTAHVTKESLKEPMLTFGGHLLSLLGTPQSGSLPLRLSTLSRIRSADLLLRASSSLGSLARLSKNLASISIPRSVADGVTRSLDHLELACANLGNAAGLKYARIAEEEAERAFFEKSMVGQLYFPEEHKIAVYLPLLGPVGVPLVMGLLGELKRWKQRRRERAAAAKEKKGQ